MRMENADVNADGKNANVKRRIIKCGWKMRMTKCE